MLPEPVDLRAKTGIRTVRTGLMIDREELRHHIEAAAPGDGATALRLASLIVGVCWPGGSEDRSERAAREWFREWHTEMIATELPACSCATGRCILCN
jgi:hypothetical protein